MLPGAAVVGLTDAIDQLTAWLEVPVTVAMNCCCWEALKVTFCGLTLTVSVPPLLAPPKKAPLTTSLTPPTQLTLNLTWPDMFHTRYTPLLKLVRVRVSSTALVLASTT